MAHMGKWYGEVDKRRKQLMVENQSMVDRVDSSTKKPSTRKLSTSNHPAFALLLLAGTLLLLALACLPSPALAATPITTCTELQNIRNNLGGDYYLANDINCSGFGNFEPIGTWSSIFTGTFDGKGYKITHLKIFRPQADIAVGLFGCTGLGSKIKNVWLEKIDVRGNSTAAILYEYPVGGLVGYNHGNGTITNSSSSGLVGGDSIVGGLVGHNDGTITNSSSSGLATGSVVVGGLVGRNDGIITNSSSSGLVGGDTIVGGLVGYNWGGEQSRIHILPAVSLV